MKQFFLVVIVAIGANVAVQAQTKPKPKLKVVNPAGVVKPAASILRNSTDSFSYALGVNIANNLQQQGVENISDVAMQKAMNDVFKKRTLLLNAQQCNGVIQEAIQANMSKKNEIVKAAGASFLAANRKKPGIITLPDGLQYEVLKKGDENAPSPTILDTVVAHYAGTLIDGQEFDNSYKRGEPITIGVGSVIRGWTEILQRMHVGDKFKVFIPSELGYGDRGAGPNIPGGSVLIFEMELLSIKPATAAPATALPDSTNQK